MVPLRFLSGAMCLLCIGSAYSYEVGTHAALTRNAYARFLAESPKVLSRLGLRDDSLQDVSNYFDVSATRVALRGVNPFETEAMKKWAGAQDHTESLAGWLMRGAVREDDDPSENDPSPKGDDPYGDVHRVFRHFFDPTDWSALVVRGLDPCSFTHDEPAPCQSAVNWGLGVADAANKPNVADAGRRNHFSVFDAREAMWRALTLTTPADGGQLVPLEVGADAAQRETTRKQYWATAFRALGDVLHLNQDMAQPQHTRNDPHSGVGPYLLQSMFTGHKSTYEIYVEMSVRGEQWFSLNGKDPVPGSPNIRPINISYDGYPTPRFARYVDYWTASQNRGLADFSNRNFFSAGKNLGDLTNAYTLPVRTASAYTREEVPPTLWDGTVVTVESPMHLLKGGVQDSYTGQVENGVPLSAVGMWDQFAQPIGQSAYTLVRENYLWQAHYLIPRAVAYSAGLLGHFFRGSMEISLPDDGVYSIADHSRPEVNEPNTGGFRRLRLKLANTTPSITMPEGTPQAQAMTQGTLVAVAKFHLDTCYVADLTRAIGTGDVPAESCRDPIERIVVSKPLVEKTVDTEPQTFDFDFEDHRIPINATDLYLQVVYRGTLGSEDDAVVVATQDIMEPMYWAYVNVIDYMACWKEQWRFADRYGNFLPEMQYSLWGNWVPGDPWEFDRTLLDLGFEPQYSVSLMHKDRLMHGEFVRVAALLDRGRHTTQIAGDWGGGCPLPQKVPVPTVAIQLSEAGQISNRFVSLRKVNAHMLYFCAKWDQVGTGCDVSSIVGEPDHPLPSIKEVTINGGFGK